MRPRATPAGAETPPSLDDARDFLALLLAGHPVPNANVGMGETLRFAFGGLADTGLAVGDELATLTAFAHDDDGATGSAQRSAIGTPVRRV